MLKKIVIWGFVAIVVLALLAVAAVFLSLNTLVKKGVETAGPQLTKSEVKLASARLSPFSGSGQLSGLVIGNPEGFKTPTAIKVGELKVVVDIASFNSDVIIIKSLRLQNPEITYDGGLTGDNNISKLLDNVKAATGGSSQAGTTTTGASAGKKFIVQDVIIEGAKLNAHLSGVVNKEITLPLPPIHLQNLGSRGNGLLIGEVVQQIITPLLANITESMGKEAVNLGKEAAGNILNGAGKEAGKTFDKAGDAIKGLFKK